MRNNALTICCGVCVAGAFGVFTRWMQDLTAFDEHGLYVRGNIWGAVLLLLCIAAAGATSEDTTLPMLVRYTSEETVVFAVLNGILCSALVPVLISLFC